MNKSEQNLIKALWERILVHDDLRRDHLRAKDSFLAALKDIGMSETDALVIWESDLRRILLDMDSTAEEIQQTERNRPHE